MESKFKSIERQLTVNWNQLKVNWKQIEIMIQQIIQYPWHQNLLA